MLPGIRTAESSPVARTSSAVVRRWNWCAKALNKGLQVVHQRLEWVVAAPELEYSGAMMSPNATSSRHVDQMMREER